MKKRIDLILVGQGFAPSRAKAGDYVRGGHVYVNGKVVKKVSETFLDDSIVIELRNIKSAYVSRGGLKLEKALSKFNINLIDKICLDIGASTGGFTDCMLKHGAARIYAVDSGYGQLNELLKNDKRVINIERTNFRYLHAKDLPEPIYFAAADVSFISLKLIIPAAYDILAETGEMVCLIKPQFEAGISNIPKSGIVNDKKVHFHVIKEIATFSANIGFTAINVDFSPIRGGNNGNIEYLLYLIKQSQAKALKLDYQALVDRAHEELSKI